MHWKRSSLPSSFLHSMSFPFCFLPWYVMRKAWLSWIGRRIEIHLTQDCNPDWWYWLHIDRKAIIHCYSPSTLTIKLNQPHLHLHPITLIRLIKLISSRLPSPFISFPSLLIIVIIKRNPRPLTQRPPSPLLLSSFLRDHFDLPPFTPIPSPLRENYNSPQMPNRIEPAHKPST